MDRNNREEAQIKAADHELLGYMPKTIAEDFLSTAYIAIPFSWIDNDPEKITKEINQLRKVIDGIGEVKLENESNNMTAEPVLMFNWFPFTLSKAYLRLYSDFIMKLIHKICNNESFFSPQIDR